MAAAVCENSATNDPEPPQNWTYSIAQRDPQHWVVLSPLEADVPEEALRAAGVPAHFVAVEFESVCETLVLMHLRPDH